MADAPSGEDFTPSDRSSKRDTLSGSITGRLLSSGIVSNVGAQVLGPYTVTNTHTLTITSTISNSANPAGIIGAIPYSIVFFETSLDTTTIIPGGSAITQGNYFTYGPFSMGEFQPGGSDGHNVVYKTSIYNISGITKTLYAITDTRILLPAGVKQK